MTEGKNPEDKPSFFDISEEEARSWPPANSYETEEEIDVPETATKEVSVEKRDIRIIEDEEDLIAPKLEVEPAPIEESSEVPEADDKYLDMFFTDFSSFDGIDDGVELTPEEEEQQDILVPIVKQEEPEPVKPEPILDIPLIIPSPKEKPPTAREKEEREALDAILGSRPESQVTKKDTVEIKKPEDFDVDSMLSPASSSKAKSSETATEVDSSVNKTIEEYDINSAIEEEDETSLPFRTYSPYDYNDETLTEASLDEAQEKQGLKLNRNILIVLSILLLVGGWYGIKSLFNRKIPGVTNARKRKPPKKEQKSLVTMSRELIPVWEITSQKTISKNQERELVNDIYKESGRVNPFVVPESVLADLKRVADAAIVNTQKPKTYRRKAYRATLVGVLTSKDNTIALVNYQEAVFDVLEGTTRPKILKLATKAMDKAKANTQEMVIGSYIGPWQITKMDSPKDAFTEAKVYLTNQGQSKVLSMGRAEELGIFDDAGSIDNLDSSSEESAEEADATPAADDFEF